ncbi:MAG: glycosyltransferase [Pseudomonadota bacterium]
MMVIAYVGNFEARTPSGELFSTESHLSASLEQLGHTVVRLQENRVTAEQVAFRVRECAADLFLWTKTGEWLRGDREEMLRVIKCPTVAYHLDLYAGLPRSANVDSEPWWRCKYVFTADGGSDDFWREHRINHYWAPPGVYGKECYLAEPGPERYDVIFVGSGKNGYHPEWPYRKQLLDWLANTYGERFVLFGRGGELECVRGAALNQLYASAKVVVGDSLCLGFQHRRYWSDRVPETLGRGGFLIHPAVSGLEQFFRNREHLVTYDYGDFDGLKQTIDYYLAHDEERETIRLVGHEEVKSRHTYANRMAWMLETVRRSETRVDVML